DAANLQETVTATVNCTGGTTPAPTPEPTPTAKKTVCDTVYSLVRVGGSILKPVYGRGDVISTSCQEVDETCEVTYETVTDTANLQETEKANIINCE
ncbi:MAG: hypothetical protein K2O66_04095, partial [Bacteroidales bacterium]|nr:hypothetical protein [Bacteroidales bacterium]